MLDHPPALDRPPPAPGGAPGVLHQGSQGAAGNAGWEQRIQACRAAYLTQPPGTRLGWLQTIGLGRLRTRLGSRWPELRERVVALVEHALAHELGPRDLYVDASPDLLHIVRIGRERAEVARHGELLTAEVTARLWGTVPRGVALTVRTVPFDVADLLHDAMTVGELRAQLDACAQRHELAPAAAQGVLAASLQPRFQPILHVRKRLVSAYRLTAWGEGAAFVAPSEACASELDAWSLRQALELCRRPAPGRAPALVLPVHYATLVGMRRRELFTQHCRLLPARSARELIFEVVGLPAGVPQARVRELMSYLRPFCLAIAVRLERTRAGLDHLASCGIRGLSASAAELAGDNAAEALVGLAGTARVHGMRSLLVGVEDATIYRLALAAGIDHVCGDGLMPPLTRPGRAFLIG